MAIRGLVFRSPFIGLLEVSYTVGHLEAGRAVQRPFVSFCLGGGSGYGTCDASWMLPAWVQPRRTGTWTCGSA